MTLPATDAFTDTDGVTINAHNANWVITVGDIRIASNGYEGNADNTNHIARWTGDTFADNQYSQIKVTAIDGYDIGVGLRVQSSGVNDYIWSAWNTGSNLYKHVGGTGTQLGVNGAGVSVNGIIRLEISGTTLIPKINNNLTSPPGAQTDTSFSSGEAGIYAWHRGLSVGDDWEAGNLDQIIIGSIPNLTYIRL